MSDLKKIKCRKYDIIVGEDSFENLEKYINFHKYSKLILISEERIYNLWQDKINRVLKDVNKILFPNGETVKSINTIEYICKKLVEVGADRKSLIINIGGGMITDLGGFCASIYMRGIDYINIPTSLLAMVDASIGGKNGVNIENIKNIVGCFNEPKLVLIDVSFLKTLPSRELKSAYGEIVKHAIIFDKNYFNLLTRCTDNFDKKMLLEIILHSLKIKKYFVEKDLKEKGLRKILNFGHTIGHGIEAIGFNLAEPFLHGEAVLLGMFFETKIAEKKMILLKNDAANIYQCLKKYGVGELLKVLKNNKEIFKTDSLLSVIQKDKKNQNGAIKMVLPVKISKCKYDVLITEKEIKECLNF